MGNYLAGFGESFGSILLEYSIEYCIVGFNSTLFSWLATLYGGTIRLAVPMLYAIAFLFLFTLGGVTGVSLANASLDWAFHDGYFGVGQQALKNYR